MSTYYFLLDEFNILHVCSNGMTRCGLSAMDMLQVEDKDLKIYELCHICQVPSKTATFVSKAEFIGSEEEFV